MPRYDHLSKAGSRLLKRLEDVPKRGQKRAEQFMNKALPEFVRPRSRVIQDETQRFQSEKDWKFLPGDRVVITHGKHKGNVAVIKDLETATNSFILDENGPSKQVPVAKNYWLENQSSHLLALPVSVKRKHLKLVADLEDPENPGTTKTVAIKDVTFNGTYYDKDRKKVMPYRCVVGRPDLVIPWPVPEPTEDGPLGTDPKVARQQTFWIDTIVRNRVPRAAFLTLRNPHSKYKKRQLAPRDIAKLVAPQMPLSETKKKFLEEREMLASREKPQLTDEDIEMIGKRVKEHLSA